MKRPLFPFSARGQTTARVMTRTGLDLRNAPAASNGRPPDAPPGWAPEGTVRAGDPGTQKNPAALPKGMQPYNELTLYLMLMMLGPQHEQQQGQPRPQMMGRRP